MTTVVVEPPLFPGGHLNCSCHTRVGQIEAHQHRSAPGWPPIRRETPRYRHSHGSRGTNPLPQGNRRSLRKGQHLIPHPWTGTPRCQANGGLCLERRLFGWRNRADANSPSYLGAAVSSSGMCGNRAQMRSVGTWAGPPPSWITARSRAPSGMWSRSKCTPRRAASVIWSA